MLPHEVQAAMAKVLFIIFSVLVLSFGRANADQIPVSSYSSNSYKDY